MKYVVPTDIGSSLRVLPPDTYEAEITDVSFGESAQNKPKCTVIFTIKSEYTGVKEEGFQSCVGEKVIDTVSLQPQAMFKINDYFKAATGDRIPANEDGYDKDEFEELIKENLIGANMSILLETDTSQGDERTKVKKFTALKKSAKNSGGKKLKR
jgi:hypothetical protein